MPFNPDDFRHPPVAGAQYAPLGDALASARARKSLEKMLRDQAAGAARAKVFTSAELDLVSQPGETRDAFAARCAEVARARAAEEEASIVRKYEPKLQRLAVARDAARATYGGAPITRQAKLREKVIDAEASLAEALAERRAKIESRKGELLGAASAIAEREIAVKKDGLSVEGYVVAWVAG
jgi:hypothetical protein